jgi:hypothetical protein
MGLEPGSHPVAKRKHILTKLFDSINRPHVLERITSFCKQCVHSRVQEELLLIIQKGIDYIFSFKCDN